MKLTDAQCDELRRVVTEKLQKITPTLAPTAYRVELFEVGDGTKPIENHFLLEVHVPSAHGAFLHATGSQEVFVKTDAGKHKLTSLELQLEVLRRHALPLPNRTDEPQS